MFFKNNKNTKQRFTIKKYSFGAASVLIGTFFAMSSEIASADTKEVTLEPSDFTLVSDSTIQMSLETQVSEAKDDKVSVDTLSTIMNKNDDHTEMQKPLVASVPSVAASIDLSELPEEFEELSEEEQAMLLEELSFNEAEENIAREVTPDDHKVDVEEYRVIHEPYVEVTGAKDNRFVDVTSTHLDTLKTLKEATVYFEFKPTSDLSGQYSLYKVGSEANKNSEYFKIYYDNGTVKVEGRNKVGQFYNLTSGTLSFTENRWNNLAFTIKPLAGNAGSTSLYVNGEQSFSGLTPRGGLFIKDIPTVDSVQIGEDSSGYNGARSFVIKDFSVYNKALSSTEVEKRTEHIKKEVLQSDEGNSGRSKKTLVYESAYNREAKEQGVKSFRAPSVLKTKNGTLLAFAAAHKNHHIDWGDINTVVKRSEDGGKTWSDFKSVVSLPENPASTGVVVSPFTIDSSVVQDEKTGRIFVVMDMFKQGRGVFESVQDVRPGYTAIDGKSYLNVYTSQEDKTPHTVRNGRVYTPDGKETDYTVITPELSKKADHSDIGTIYKDDKEIGNIYFTDKSASPFSTVQSSSTWLVTSDDDGKTWSAPTDITPQVKKPWMDLLLVTPNAGLQLKNGRLVVPVYTSNKIVSRHYTWASSVIYSDDLGKTWHYGESPEDYVDAKGKKFGAALHNGGESTTTESTVVQLNSGTLVSFARSSTNKFVMAKSTDNGETWQDDLKTWTELPSFRVQPSATHYSKDGKEYVLVSATDGTPREKGTIYLFEVNENDKLEFVKSKLIEAENFTYSSLVNSGEDNFTLLYENTDAGYDLFSIQRRTFTFDWLIKDESETDEVVKIVSVKKRLDGHYDVVFDHHVTPTKDTELQLSNGKTLAYVGQTELNTLVFSGNIGDTIVHVSGLKGVDSQSELTFDTFDNPIERLTEIPYKVIEETKSTLKKGERRIRVEGHNGQSSQTIAHGFDTATGQLVDVILFNKLLKAPVNQIVEIGTLEQVVPTETLVADLLPEIVVEQKIPTDAPMLTPKSELDYPKDVSLPLIYSKPEIVIEHSIPKVAPVHDTKPVITIANEIPMDYPTVSAKPEIVIEHSIPKDAPVHDAKPVITIANQVMVNSSTVDMESKIVMDIDKLPIKLGNNFQIDSVTDLRKNALYKSDILASNVSYSRVQRKLLMDKKNMESIKELPRTGEKASKTWFIIGSVLSTIGISKSIKRRKMN